MTSSPNLMRNVVLHLPATGFSTSEKLPQHLKFCAEKDVVLNLPPRLTKLGLTVGGPPRMALAQEKPEYSRAALG